MTTQASTNAASGRMPDRAASIPLSELPQYLARNAPAFFRRVWKEERHWLLAFAPFLLLVGYTYSLARKSWVEFDTSLILQPFIPLFAAWLAWSRRQQLANLYQELAFAFPDDSPKRRGNVWGIVVGCVMILLASFAMITPMALLGLIITVAGAVYFLYGPFILRALWQPLLFLLLMVPPPGGFLARITNIFQVLGAFITTSLFEPIYPRTQMQGIRVLLGGNVALDITPPLSGISIVVPLLMLTLWLCILRRVRVAPSLVIMVCATFIGVGLNLLRLIALGVIGMNSPQLAGLLLRSPSWLLVAVGFYATFLVMKRVTRPRRSKIMAMMSDEEEDEDDFDLDDYTDDAMNQKATEGSK